MQLFATIIKWRSRLPAAFVPRHFGSFSSLYANMVVGEHTSLRSPVFALTADPFFSGRFTWRYASEGIRGEFLYARSFSLSLPLSLSLSLSLSSFSLFYFFFLFFSFFFSQAHPRANKRGSVTTLQTSPTSSAETSSLSKLQICFSAFTRSVRSSSEATRAILRALCAISVNL